MVTKHDSGKKQRRSIRLKEHDYSKTGAYFITICTQKHKLLLNNNKTRLIVEKWWDAIPVKFPAVHTDQFIIMPNHIHGIIIIGPVGADQCVCPDSRGSTRIAPRVSGELAGSPLQQKPALGKIIQWFKPMTTNDYIRNTRTANTSLSPIKLWQRNYYEHIIRDEDDLYRIRQYISENPLK